MNWTTTKTGLAVVAAAIAAGSVVHLLKQGELTRLQDENRKLASAQQDLVEERDVALAEAANARGSDLSEKERRELMQLRGEITQLRKNQGQLENLRQQNQALENSLFEAQQAAAPSAPAMDSLQLAAIERMNDSKQLVLALVLYADANDSWLPDQLSSTSNYWGDAQSTQRLLTNQFELVAQGSFTAIANPAETILVRERKPTLIDGTWKKVYGFADGHSEVVAQPPEGFEAWERARMMPQQ